MFFLFEFFIHLSFRKYRKLSELLSIVVFLFCAWLLTENDIVISIFGGILLAIAMLSDLYRRKLFTSTPTKR